MISDFVFFGDGRLEYSLNVVAPARYRPQLVLVRGGPGADARQARSAARMRRLLLAALGRARASTGVGARRPARPEGGVRPGRPGAREGDRARAERPRRRRGRAARRRRPRSLKAPVCPSLRPDYSKLTLTGHAESVFDNGNGGVQIVSDVEVWKTAKQAEQHMDALLKPALPKCIQVLAR